MLCREREVRYLGSSCNRAIKADQDIMPRPLRTGTLQLSPSAEVRSDGQRPVARGVSCNCGDTPWKVEVPGNQDAHAASDR